jgi:chemotaxis protein methyltransferase CheR
MMSRPLTSPSPAREANVDALQDLEIRLLLQGVYERYGYDFRDYQHASRRRRVIQCLRDEGLATVSALQDRVLHDGAAL